MNWYTVQYTNNNLGVIRATLPEPLLGPWLSAIITSHGPPMVNGFGVISQWSTEK